MRTITKRQGRAKPLDDIRVLQRTINRLHGQVLVPRGIYRFSNFQEADQWMKQQMAATHVRQSSKNADKSDVLYLQEVLREESKSSS